MNTRINNLSLYCRVEVLQTLSVGGGGGGGGGPGGKGEQNFGKVSLMLLVRHCKLLKLIIDTICRQSNLLMNRF